MTNLITLLYIFLQYDYYYYHSHSSGSGTGNLLVIWFICSIICAILCAIVAGDKKHSAGVWGFIGFLFGIFALIAVAGLPKEDKPRIIYKPCPRCLQNVKKGAEVCPYCGFEFDKESVLEEVIEIGKIIKNNYSLRSEFSGVFNRKDRKYIELYRKMLEKGLLPTTYYRNVIFLIAEHEKENSFPLLLDLMFKEFLTSEDVIKAGKKAGIEKFKKYVKERAEEEKGNRKLSLEVVLKKLKKEEK